MNGFQRGTALVTSGVLFAALIAAPPAAAGSSHRPKKGGTKSVHTVTLITGDVVRVETRRDGSVLTDVVKRTGRSTWYDTSKTRTGVYIQPEEASGALAAKVVDRELFNVTSLVKQGYDDAHSARLPLIVSYGGSKTSAKPDTPKGAVSVRALSSINGRSATVEKSSADTFWTSLVPASTRSPAAPARRLALASGVAKVWLDQKVQASLDKSVPLIGGPAAWGRGYDGTGVKAVVLDSGADTTHPDLAGKIDVTKNFTGSGGATDVTDRFGHGTHVASIVAGTGAASSGKYKGVAPGAHLIIGKVLGDTGSGSFSGIISGMEWAAQQGTGVVNMSLGGAPTNGDDPASQAINNLTAQTGTLFVVAAGNRGPHDAVNHVTTPATADSALAVGATTKEDDPTSFSRVGRMDDKVVKPEIMAPGFLIRAAQSSTAEDDGDQDPRYREASGTSMASPHVAGAALLLRQQHPDWTAGKLKAALISTANPPARPTDVMQMQARAGRLDVDRATRQKITVDTSVFHAGYFSRPYPADMKVTRTLTYHNGSSAAVTLNLTGENVVPEGQTSPPGVIGVSPATLTVPAGGSASATVTVDVGAADPGQGNARVVATAGADEVRTIIGFYKQNDTTDVNIKVLDRNGEPANAYVWVKPYEGDVQDWYYDPIRFDPSASDGLTVRLDPAKYFILASISTMDASGRYAEHRSYVGDPLVEAKQPNFSITLDARKANPVTLSTPRAAEPRSTGFGWSRGSLNRWYTRLQFTNDTFTGRPSKLSVAPTETVSDAPFMFMTGIDASPAPLKTEMTAPVTKTLNATYSNGPNIDGVRTHAAVDAGSARPEDLEGKDLNGKVAVVKESSELSLEAQAHAVAEKGAAEILIYSAQPGVLWPQWWSSPPLPALTLSKAEGEDIVQRLASGPVTIRFTGTPRAPYAYELFFPHQNAIPNTMAYSVTASQLATVNNRIHSFGAANEYTTFTHAGLSNACEGCGSVLLNDFSPTRGHQRTEYVTARSDVEVLSAIAIGTRFDIWPTSGRSYTAGQTLTQNWLRGPLAPGPSNNQIASLGTDNNIVRTETGGIAYKFAGARDSDGHWTEFPVGTRKSRFYKDNTLISENEAQSGWVSVPPENATYRLELDTTQDGSAIPFSTTTKSAWTFSSQAVSVPTKLPLVDVLYTDLTGQSSSTSLLDLADTAGANQAVALRLKAGHQTGSINTTAQVTKVEVSYDDGTTWRPTTVSGSSGSYRALYTHPVLTATNGYVAIRISAQDGNGNKLDQTITRAYRLKA